MPAPQELPQQIPAPLPGKSLDAKAPGWGQIFGVNPGGARGDSYGAMVIDEIDSCITRLFELDPECPNRCGGAKSKFGRVNIPFSYQQCFHSSVSVQYRCVWR